MKDLVDFKNYQIKALQDKVSELEKLNTTLHTWVFELTQDNCPKEYAKVLRTELTKINKQ